MKKSELKNIIKECVREVIFEDGMLSGIVSEVVQGMGTASLVQEQVKSAPQVNQRIADSKKQVLNAIASNSYEDVKQKFTNPELFEGTKPIVEGNGQGALAGVSPNDPGVDISNIPGFGSWSNVASTTRK